MTARIVSILAALAFAAPSLTACGGATVDGTQAAAKKAAPAPKQPLKLNLSHILCDDGTGKVEVHFVLLNFGSASAPGDLEFRYEDAPDYTGDAKALTVQAGKNTGNVWHYTAYLDPGWVKIVAAELVNDREAVSLHNPGEYANAYCDGVLRCGVAVIHPEYPDSEPPEYLVDGQSFCADLPNYDAESQGHDDDACQVLGLVWDGKVNLTDPSSVEAHKSAYVALLKSGSGGPAGCKGRFSYRIYFDVSEGETLYAPEQTGSISHVTYCKCPAPEAAE